MKSPFRRGSWPRFAFDDFSPPHTGPSLALYYRGALGAALAGARLPRRQAGGPGPARCALRLGAVLWKYLASRSSMYGWGGVCGQCCRVPRMGHNCASWQNCTGRERRRANAAVMRHASTESETNMQNQGAAKLESLAGSSRPRGCFDVAYSPQKEGRLGAQTTLIQNIHDHALGLVQPTKSWSSCSRGVSLGLPRARAWRSGGGGTCVIWGEVPWGGLGEQWSVVGVRVAGIT